MGSDIDPKYGFLSVKYIEQTVVEGETPSKKASNLNFIQCGDKNFNFHKEKEIKKNGINNFGCLTDKNYELIGSSFREEMKYLEIKLFKCQNATSNPNYQIGVNKGVTC